MVLMNLGDAIKQKGNTVALHKVTAKLDTGSKHFHQNQCHCAGGKCERCKATDCRDRNWREQGKEVP
jgi:hypothetical protein